MGMYTEIFFRAEIDEEAAAVIQRLFDGDLSRLDWPDHEFFKAGRFQWIATGGSWYFPHANHTVIEQVHAMHEDPWFASFRANIKNYDDEIAKFFDWVSPHVIHSDDHGEVFIGYSLYEEASVPNLHYAKNPNV